MRPLKLIMSAFGPYASVEEIDFTKLQGKNIFVISGPTGAGKTTIFDAISYAIYGEASGSDRKQENFRSDFASDDVLTYVELLFELHGKSYYIKRIPNQKKKKARGNGYTEQKSDAEFKDIAEGKIISGVKDVDTKVIQVMGINYRQFKQLVMLPQGEFKELLIADSKSKGEILGKIFNTDEFLKIQYKLDDMAKKLFYEVDGFKKSRITNIQNINSGDNGNLRDIVTSDSINTLQALEELKHYIIEDKIYKKTMDKELEVMQESVDKIKDEITLGIQINQNFMAKDLIEQEKSVLEAKKESVNLKIQSLKNAKNARSIKSEEELFFSNGKAVKDREKTKLLIKDSIKDKQKDLKISKDNYEKEQGKSEEGNRILSELTIFKGYYDKVASYEEKKSRINVLERNLNNCETQKNTIKIDIENREKVSQHSFLEIEKSRKAALEFLKLSSELEGIKNTYSGLNKLLLELEKLDGIREKYINANRENKKYGLLYDHEKKEYDKFQWDFIRGFAGKLAEDLKEGEPCPVCGSIHHTKKAKNVAVTLSEEDLKLKSENLEITLKSFNDNSKSLERFKVEGEAQKSVVDNAKDELAVSYDSKLCTLQKTELTAFVRKSIVNIKNQINEMNKRYKELDQQQKLVDKLQLDYEANNKNLVEHRTSLEKININYTEIYGEVQGEKRVILELENELPENIRTKESLKLKIESLTKEHNDITKALENAQKELENCKIQHSNLLRDLAISEIELKNANLEWENSKINFDKKIKLAGFMHMESFLSSKLSEENIENLENEIKEYNEKVKSNEDRYKDILIRLNEKNIVDIDELNEKLKVRNYEKQKIYEINTKLFSRIEHNESILKNILTINDHIEKIENQYRNIGELSNVANGKNTEKLTFERYVLASYFDQIIDAANMRFSKMTANRYEMSRIKAKGKGAAQSGLEIEVFDNYTGRYRHIKTLSGGESFKASLSLALGLSDVVQSYAGGISLDTMFIDEGFGTLDTESLDNAIQCLINLQNTGRLVGIISHVQELKDRIDARLEIETDSQGSTTRFIVK
ncbi:SbcC/MukB-like Walker B domain-containing protein [Clostridium akagii]|uniref:SbcC/MukB-like Walker B domain-containing protein n=1 Tax=Clostridium akagii TaxID=91623 RepID=UPI000479AA1A|nr:SMC family ATPase [Clostridium akagii]